MHYLIQNNIRHYKFFPSHIFIDENFYPIIFGYTDKPLISVDWLEVFYDYSYDDIAHMAPERLGQLSFSPKSDVYSYGIMLYRFFTGKKSFSDHKRKFNGFLAKQIINGRKPDLSIIENKVFTHLLGNCLEDNPCERMNFEMIIDFITNEEFYSYYRDLDLDIFGNEFDHLKNKF